MLTVAHVLISKGPKDHQKISLLRHVLDPSVAVVFKSPQSLGPWAPRTKQPQGPRPCDGRGGRGAAPTSRSSLGARDVGEVRWTHSIFIYIAHRCICVYGCPYKKSSTIWGLYWAPDFGNSNVYAGRAMYIDIYIYIYIYFCVDIDALYIYMCVCIYIYMYTRTNQKLLFSRRLIWNFIRGPTK